MTSANSIATRSSRAAVRTPLNLKRAAPARGVPHGVLTAPTQSPLVFSMCSQVIKLRPSSVTVKANKRDLDAPRHPSIADSATHVLKARA